jgi:hypothetical protein
VSADGPYTIITEPTFVARFLLDPFRDTEDTVANADTFVELPGGSTWSLTLVTVAEVNRLLARWKDTGEAGGGSYFRAADLVIVPVPGISAMIAAIRELVRSGEITDAGTRRDDEGAVCGGQIE